MPIDRPKATFLTPIMPDETGNGLAMRMGMFAEALARIAELHVIVVRVAGGPTEPSPLLRRLGCNVDVIKVGPGKTAWFEALDRIADPATRLELFRQGGETTLAGYLTPQVRAQVGRLINCSPPDILHVGRAYLASLGGLADLPTLRSLDLDEADRNSLALQAATIRASGDRLRAEWTEQEGVALDRVLAREGSNYSRIFISSAREARLLAGSHIGLSFDVAPNAVAIPDKPERKDDGRSLAFIGSFGFEPNVHAITEFCRETWPLISSRVEGARLLIAGRNPPPEIVALAEAPGVAVLGTIDDIDSFYAQTTLAIAPLAAGGGTRIKLLEASAHQVPWIATEIGAAGIDWPEGAGGWIAPVGEAFANACVGAFNSPRARDELAQEGYNFVADRYNRATIIDELASLFIGDLKRARL